MSQVYRTMFYIFIAVGAFNVLWGLLGLAGLISNLYAWPNVLGGLALLGMMGFLWVQYQRGRLKL